jgi:hypothetical protein
MDASPHAVDLVCRVFWLVIKDAQLAFWIASKFMIDTGAGVIDADYRGTVFVLLFNLSDKEFEGAL